MINLKKIKSYVLWKANVLKTPLKIYCFKKLNMKKRSYILPKRKQKIIVSLTSYSKRFNSLDLCIKSIMTQTVKPDRIILYVTEEEKDVVPDKLLDLEKYGLEIRYVYEDYKPHKKYMYAVVYLSIISLWGISENMMVSITMNLTLLVFAEYIANFKSRKTDIV